MICISTNNITELNELIYAGVKLVCEKIGIPSKITKEKSKPGWEFRLETQIKKKRKQLKVIKQKENAGINRNRKESTTQEKLTIQREKIYPKVLVKDWRDIDKGLNNTDKIEHSKIMKENSMNNWKGMTIRHTNKRMEKKPNDSGQKYGNQKT